MIFCVDIVYSFYMLHSVILALNLHEYKCESIPAVNFIYFRIKYNLEKCKNIPVRHFQNTTREIIRYSSMLLWLVTQHISTLRSNVVFIRSNLKALRVYILYLHCVGDDYHQDVSKRRIIYWSSILSDNIFDGACRLMVMMQKCYT